MRKGLKEGISELECRVMVISPFKENGGDWRKESTILPMISPFEGNGGDWRKELTISRAISNWRQKRERILERIGIHVKIYQ